jgi:hypothetical protein
MRALVLQEFDGPDGVVLTDVAPLDDDRGRLARIEVHAAGVSLPTC